MFDCLRRLCWRYRLWVLQREVSALELYGNRADPKVKELIRDARAWIAWHRQRNDCLPGPNPCGLQPPANK